MTQLKSSPISETSMVTGADEVDVLIMGGGLAGLSLALQLRRRFAGLRIRVLERNTYPVPIAAHKIGESTVEIGAHYFSQVLGLKPHLEQDHLKKFGFRFFFSEGRRDLDQVTEIGASKALDAPSYQIDRGVFENFLADHARANDIDLIDGAMVKGIALEGVDPKGVDPDTEQSHQIRWLHQGEQQHTNARWVVDACGRAGLIKRKLGLAEPNEHNAHAIWFRVKGHIRIDDWVESEQWQSRVDPETHPKARWLSTNHLVGEGYWVWLIPLSSGHHSVGIVADPRYHTLDQMNSFDKAMDWLRTYQPRLFDELDPRRDDLLDFAFYKRFSYGCKQVFGADRWALTGEAGLFLDPFYSPGSDFIAISNTLITELISRDQAGERLGAHTHIYNQIYQSFYESTMTLYQDQYGIFGDPEVLPRKIIWDYTYYWGVLSQLFFQDRISDLTMLSRLRDELAHCQALNIAVQQFLREWSAVSQRRNPAVMHDQASIPWFVELNKSLHDELDADAFKDRIQASCRQLSQLARELAETACADYPQLDATALQDAIDRFPKALGAQELQPSLLKAAELKAA